MSYQIALEMAGATVLEYEEFGSYQGDWFAKVEYQGKEGWVQGLYGSCSGCDSFLSEFDFQSHYVDNMYHSLWDNNFPFNNCEQCAEIQRRLSLFGESYLTCMMNQSEAEAYVKQNIGWDSEAQIMVDFITSHALTNETIA